MEDRVFRHPENGMETIARNELHVAAFEKEGFVEVEQTESKKK